MYRLFRNVADIIALRVDAQNLSMIFNTNWWQQSGHVDVWKGAKDGQPFQQRDRVTLANETDADDRQFYEVWGEAFEDGKGQQKYALTDQSSYELRENPGVKPNTIRHSVDILDVVQTEQLAATSTLTGDQLSIIQQRRIQVQLLPSPRQNTAL